MEHLAAVAERIAVLREAATTVSPAPGREAAAAFSALFTRHLAATAGGSGAPGVTPLAAVTLGQMVQAQAAGSSWATSLAAALPVSDTLAGALPGAQLPPAAPVAPLGPPTAAPPAPAENDGMLLRPVEGRYSSRFGPRTHPVTGRASQHGGIDLAAPTGTPIKAAAEGVVSFAGMRGGYGNLVIIDHADGTQTYYAHQHSLGVQAGDRVERGAVIGTVGSTGRSTGPHLHFELRRGGTPVDPAPLIGL